MAEMVFVEKAIQLRSDSTKPGDDVGEGAFLEP
jgi:hypothetical protein